MVHPAEDRSMLRVFGNGHPAAERLRFQPGGFGIPELISEFERPFLDGDAELASLGRERLFRPAVLAQGEGQVISETQDGPAWSAHRPPEYEAPPNQTPRVFRIKKRASSIEYDDRDARYIVEVWRGQRRHPGGMPCSFRAAGVPTEAAAATAAAAAAVAAVTDDFWRYEQSVQMALRLGTGTVERSLLVDQYDHNPDNLNESFAKEVCRPCRIVVGYYTLFTPLVSFLAQIVFQQLDMHPIRGSWNNAQKRFLGTASPDEPLAFLDFIEDAALAIPPACRRKLPRCLHIPRRSESNLFKKPSAGVSCWPDSNAGAANEAYEDED